MESKEKQKRMLKKYLETGLYVFLAVAVIYFVLNFVGQRTSVSGDSMYPSLKNGDQLILEKISNHEAPNRSIVLNAEIKIRESSTKDNLQTDKI